MATSDDAEATPPTGRDPQLIAVCGLPGVGKSTVARWIVDRVDGVHLRTDEIRKELFPDPDYTEVETRAVYRTLLDRGREAVARGETAVLDATFKRRAHREGIPRVAVEAGVDWRLIRVAADEAVAKQRIRDRTDDVSDADIEIYELFAREFEPITLDHEVVDNSGTLAATETALEDRFPRDRTPLVQ